MPALWLMQRTYRRYFWKGIPVQLCSSWQDFNWLKASRGPSAIAELLVTGQMFFLTPNQQCQSTEGKISKTFANKEKEFCVFSVCVILSVRSARWNVVSVDNAGWCSVIKQAQLSNMEHKSRECTAFVAADDRKFCRWSQLRFCTLFAHTTVFAGTHSWERGGFCWSIVWQPACSCWCTTNVALICRKSSSS